MMDRKSIQQNLKIRRILPWIAVATALVISYAGFIQPIRRTVFGRNQTQHMEMLCQDRLSQLKRLTDRQKQQRAKLTDWKQQHDFLFFTPSEADVFFANLDQKTASLGCRIISAEYQNLDMFQSAPDKTAASVKLRQAKIRLAGQYDHWISFLEWIESLPQSVLISSLRLELQKDRSGILIGRIDFAIPVTNQSQQGENADDVIRFSEERSDIRDPFGGFSVEKD